ncbi:uncharacterized protein LOC143178203 [Calliopsis andreniformis]|uniref:uncharacterized protein LOC143178203 n=1 Tax=Calliopsis andreniformis TaxID=337506 RepID=UPI003FCD07B3
MEIGAGEAQICRLCGQCESIYIDVFGEEGTKRFLGLKIHTRINILIKENDGLPQNVCLRCLGTLEFLCDFYESCHLTQKEFIETNEAEAEKLPQESDPESDKENVVPPPNDAKRKANTSSPDSSKNTKNNLSVNGSSNYQVGKEESNLHPLDNNNCTQEVQPTKQTTTKLRNSSVFKKQSVLDNMIVREESSKQEQENSNTFKCRSLTLEKVDVPKATIIRSTKSESINSINDIKSEHPVQRKRGRKSKSEKIKEAGLSLTVKKKVQKNLHDYKIDNSQCKRRCLRPICTNTKPIVMLPKSQLEQIGMEQLNDPLEITTDDIDRLHSKEDFIKCKPISVIVKQEKVEVESPQQTEQKSHHQEMQQNMESLQASPLKEERKKADDMINDTDYESTKPEVFSEQNRVTVIKSSQTNEPFVPKTLDREFIKLNSTVDEMDDTDEMNEVNETDESTKDDSKCDVSELSLAERLRRNSSHSSSKIKDRSFGKISELISEEQKQIIETYYTIDMTMVNSEEVNKNLTVIDKKNIRCNICGTLYLRMDKCQVHIWGHLQMKPYQCKACNFSTVTISNVRCHIRKSHLKIKPFACHQCEKKYVTAALLEEHLNTHTGARPYQCKFCDFTSASRQMLSYHKSTHKPVKDISCKICGKAFFSRGRLRAHMIIHNKDKVVMCKLCSVYLSSQEALETHQKNIHLQDYVCNICGKRVKSRKALHNHQNVHAAAKYKCTMCPNVYKTSQILKEHLLKHEGIRKYKCSVCGKSFGQQSHLAAHMAVHSEIRYHCPGCSKAFNRHDNMKIHTKRCKLFLADPSLKDLLRRKDRNMSLGKIDMPEDLKDRNSSNSASSFEDQNEDLLTQTTDDQEQTERNFCELGLNISCIDPVDQTWAHSDVYSEIEDITRSTNVIQMTKVNDKLIPESKNLTILKNVLGPENY